MRRFYKLILIILLFGLAARVGAYTIPYETWMGVYLSDKKIGYLSFKIDNSDHMNVPGYKITSVFSNHLTVLGGRTKSAC